MWLPLVVVTVPTVCLLWFMQQAIRNERLAVKQRLIELYSRTVAQARSQMEGYWEELSAQLQQDLPRPRAAAFKHVVLHSDGCRLAKSRSAVIVGRNGRILYPMIGHEMPQMGIEKDAGLLEATRIEYVLRDHTQAARLYIDLASTSQDPYVRLAAASGAVRCLYRAGELQELVDLVWKVTDSVGVTVPTAQYTLNLKLRALEVMANASMLGSEAQFEKVLDWVMDYNHDMPSSARIFALTRLIELSDGLVGLQGRHTDLLADTKALVEAERIGIQVCELLGRPEGIIATLAPRQQGEVFGLPNDDLLGWVLQHDQDWFIVILDRQSFMTWIKGFLSDKLPPEIAIRITDEKGRSDRPIVDSEIMLAAMPAARFWPTWKAEFYARPDMPSLAAARRQQGLYIWTGTLVIMLSIVAGAVATQAVRRQVRLNRLRNDFIATVAHELKTPLASMRLLVDTLLEGTVQGQDHVREYLTLIANENIRLSGLIDKFLTFSKMERNRFTFNLQPVDPAQLVHKAVDAIYPKWNQKVHMTIQLEPDLPKICADVDAMVTVLVNLLDNAYKYTGDEKIIMIRTTTQGHYVEISVCDNGIGIPKLAQRRIFDRFYQVDKSLGRQAGGCGLGLAIVRFIVGAHNGKVRVRSRSGQGSVFTLRLPIWRRS